jgi:SIR2-like domain
MSLDRRLIDINRDVLEILHKAWQDKRLTIVVGAGASAQVGLPSWPSLLEKLLRVYLKSRYVDRPQQHYTAEIEQYFREQLKYQPPIVYAQYFHTRMGENEFQKLLHDAMYSELDSPPRPGPIHQAVAGLGHNLVSVMTFNYDDLLERALLHEGYPNTSVWRASDFGAIEGLPVYHPHGFLPYKLDPSEEYWTVLSEKDYHTQYADAFHWSNIAISRALLETTCLFVSTSLTDPNLRRLLDFQHRANSAKRHFLIWSQPLPGAYTGTDALVREEYQKIFTRSYEEFGISPVWYFERADRGEQHRRSDVPELLAYIKRVS